MRVKGFTLIELVIVIVILAILAVVASPGFINFSNAAHRSTLQGTAEALSSTSELIFQKANIEQLTDQPITCLNGKLDVSTNTCPDGGTLLHYGYPAADFDTLATLINLDSWASTSISIFPSGSIRIAPTEAELTECYILYQEATANSSATITSATENC